MNGFSCTGAQVYCYEDPKLLKLFADIIRILYDNDILGEDTIKHWYRKGSAPKVRPPQHGGAMSERGQDGLAWRAFV